MYRTAIESCHFIGSRLTGRRIRRCSRQIGQSTAVVHPASSAGRMLTATATRQRRRRSGGLNVRRIHVVRTDVLVPRTVHRLPTTRYQIAPSVPKIATLIPRFDVRLANRPFLDFDFPALRH